MTVLTNLNYIFLFHFNINSYIRHMKAFMILDILLEISKHVLFPIISISHHHVNEPTRQIVLVNDVQLGGTVPTAHSKVVAVSSSC